VSCTHILDDKPTYRDTLTATTARLRLRHTTSHLRSVSMRQDRLSHRRETPQLGRLFLHNTWLVYMNMTYSSIQAIVITVSYSSESRGPAVVLAHLQTRSRAPSFISEVSALCPERQCAACPRLWFYCSHPITSGQEQKTIAAHVRPDLALRSPTCSQARRSYTSMELLA